MVDMTVTEYAKRRGISRQAVHKMVQGGIIPASAVRKKGRSLLIDPEKADKALERNLRPSEKDVAEKVAKKAGFGDLSYSEARTLMVQFKAALYKLEYDEKLGRLVDAEAVKTAAFTQGRQVRDTLLTLPDRLAAQLAGTPDEAAVHRVLHEEITKALEGLTIE